MESFVSIDFETANHCLDSICQIGVSEFENGVLKRKWNYYVDPEDWFDTANIAIHGITPDMVKGKPTFKDLYTELSCILTENIVVHHTFFDKAAFCQACDKYGLDIPAIRWLDSAKIARRTWSQFKNKGYGLRSVADFLNIQFQHHDALEDSIAAGKIVVAAIAHTGLSINEWLLKVIKPITTRVRSQSSSYTSEYRAGIEKEGNPDGEFWGESIAFSGNFNVDKKEYSILASEMGCNVDYNLVKRTTILIVGTQNKNSLKEGEEKSRKQIAAEKRILKGDYIRILSEDDFIKLFDLN